MLPEPTEISINEYGDETHESWLLARANRVTSGPPGHRLFDSEINHQHFIMVSIARCTRKRDLNHDWLHTEDVILEMHMSEAQWGAFVSSFGDGSGVPATLSFLTTKVGPGRVPQAPVESRLAESFREVREAAHESLTEIEESYAAVLEAFDNGGRKALREALRTMGFKIKNAPANMEFAATSLAEHAENVTTKARADIEAMVLNARQRAELEPIAHQQLLPGEE